MAFCKALLVHLLNLPFWLNSLRRRFAPRKVHVYAKVGVFA